MFLNEKKSETGTYNNATEILGLKSIKEKFKVLSEYFVHAFGN